MKKVFFLGITVVIVAVNCIAMAPSTASAFDQGAIPCNSTWDGDNYSTTTTVDCLTCTRVNNVKNPRDPGTCVPAPPQ